MRNVLPILAATLVLAGCGGHRGDIVNHGPPDLTVQTAHGPARLLPWSSEWTVVDGDEAASSIGDGSPPQHPVDVGRRDLVTVHFADPGYHLRALFRSVQHCRWRVEGRVQEVDARSGSTWILYPAGPAGTWDVDVLVKGPQGDLAATYRWRTQQDAPGHVAIAPPAACLRWPSPPSSP